VTNRRNSRFKETEMKRHALITKSTQPYTRGQECRATNTIDPIRIVFVVIFVIACTMSFSRSLAIDKKEDESTFELCRFAERFGKMRAVDSFQSFSLVSFQLPTSITS
jgi:hypothetical protein